MVKFKLLQVRLIVLSVALLLGVLILGLAGCGGMVASRMASTFVPIETALPTIQTPSLAQTPRPSSIPALPSPPTPTDIPVGWLYIGDPSYGLSWRVPRHWQRIEEQRSTAAPGAVLLGAWTNDKEAALLISSSHSTFPNGLMVLTVQAVTTEAPSPNLRGARPITVSEQPGWLSSDPAAPFIVVARPGWVQEVSGAAAVPFAWHATLFIQGTSTYSYTFSLGCTPPGGADTKAQAGLEASCQRIWEQIVAGVEVVERKACLPAPTPTPGPITWRRVSDAAYKYAFEVPSGWHEDRGPTADRLVFFSDLASGDPSYCPSPDGSIKLDFAADPPGKYQPDMQPDLTGMNSITVDGRPAWIFSGEGGEAAPSIFTITVYISGPEYWYRLWMGCTPANAAVREQFVADCKRVMDHILGSFRVMP